MLLVGPPGTGKTLLARAVAGEAGVPFFSISGSEFVEMFVGVGAARVRDLFEQARQTAPAHHLHRRARRARAGARRRSDGGGHDEKEQTLNQLLVELDGFDPSVGIGAARRDQPPRDPRSRAAARRPLRPPGPGGPAGQAAAASQILEVHCARSSLAADVDPEKIAALTPGFTGADLANLVNEAALLATRRGAEAVALGRFHAARSSASSPGLEKRNRLLNPERARSRRVSRDGACARGAGAAGHGSGAQGLDHSARHRRARLHDPAPDRGPLPDDAARAREQDGGAAGRPRGRSSSYSTSSRPAPPTTSQKVTDIARSMVTRYGMVRELGHVAYESDQSGFLGTPAGFALRERSYSETTAREIDEAVKSIVDRAFDRALALLKARRAILDRGAAALLERETLAEQELLALVAEHQPPERGPAEKAKSSH